MKLNRKLFFTSFLIITLITAGSTVCAASSSSASSASGSSSSSVTTKRVKSSQINSVPAQPTASYQKYLDEKTILTGRGWKISQEHLDSLTDVYWMEGKTAEGAYFRYYSYDKGDSADTVDGEPQILASTTNATYYSDLGRYWMSGSTYDYMLAHGGVAIGYAQKTALVNNEATTIYIGYVYAWPS